jgi:large subunit ribosomal protein L23
MNVKGKIKRLGRNEGKRADWKKAIVKLAPGSQIEIFEGMS